MIRAASLALVLCTTAAQADLPSPLFCITMELCQDDGMCQPHRHSPPFVLRQTAGEWMMVYSPRGSDTWVIVGETAEAVLDSAPEGAQIALIQAGRTPDDRYIVHEHRLSDAALSTPFARHWCETGVEEPS